MAHKNCWEVMGCGRGPGGAKVSEMGLCPAATATSLHSVNDGMNGGRACWCVAGTFCGGVPQGSFVRKYGQCLRCDFFKQVRDEEGVMDSQLLLQYYLHKPA